MPKKEAELQELVEKICSQYKIGQYIKFKKMENGYDDLNIQIITSENNYLAKVFSEEKSDTQCQKYIQAIKQLIDLGVNHPQLHKNNYQYFSSISVGKLKKVRVCLMNFAEGGNLLQNGIILEKGDFDSLIKQVLLLHKVDQKNTISEGFWSVTHFKQIYDEKQHILDKVECDKMGKILEEFSKMRIDSLPHRFIHGDLVKTNIVKKTGNSLYIIDLSAAGYYPRIQELAVLLTNIFFDENSIEESKELYNFLLERYQEGATLTNEELTALPLFVLAAHCINILCPLYEKIVHGNTSTENEYWLTLGRKGLSFADELYQYRN
ncbi:MAG: phosphotransferase [bacterium]|nr:phosphotransferase [bacterium]